MAPRRTSYRGLYFPFAIVLVALAAWTVWWFVLANRIEAGVDRAAEDLRRAGYTVGWSRRSISGWPFRTFVKFEDVRLGAPSGHGVSIPLLGVEANSYDLGHWVAGAPRGLTLHRGAKGDTAVKARAIRASVSGVTATPPYVAVELLDPVFTVVRGEPFPLASAEAVALDLKPKAGAPGDAEALFRIVKGRGRPGGVLHWIAGGGDFSTRWTTTLSGIDRFRGPRWAEAVRRWSGSGGALVGLAGEAEAGQASAKVAGERLTVGEDGRLRGALDLDLAGGPAAMLAMGRSQAVDPASAAAAAGLAAAQGGLTGRARVRLVFEDGRSRLGPIRLAPAPKVF
jgi:hypothetical protein